ncbi:hypothetical protein G6M08_07675 [Agrobacterium rhizogenes]|nr:hypothetical protein [Rhizobium rhizogenes]NTG60145.1 hypothetical protein [Rhizobium rhizogenes]NTG66696.1 hypothetical protein [Rhizobium rhizogenes]NTG79668.1 hypothetical protein [Rhizobium rhizogenes]NTH95348.1 hypothetical protein [Rhizobium rhizogenes]
MGAIWTVKDVEENFVRVLEMARTVGPQRISHDTGIFVLKIEDDFTKPDATELLMKLRPKS